MRTTITMLALCALVSTGGGCAPLAPINTSFASPQSVADSLIEADRAFANGGADQATIDSLAAMLDDDVTMFVVPVPTLARGKAQALDVLQRAFGGDRSSIQWAPVRAGVSADATQGFTYGFMTRKIDGKPPQLGKYVSYWIRREAGWRVAAFKFVPRAEGAVVTDIRPPALPVSIVPIKQDQATIDSHAASLDRTERQFSDDSQTTSLRAGFEKYGSADAMNVAGAIDFTYGNEAIAATQGDSNSTGSGLRWAPDGVLVASSGDLGLTYGHLLRNEPTPPGRLAKIPFFTVWRRASPDAPWRYVAE